VHATALEIGILKTESRGLLVIRVKAILTGYIARLSVAGYVTAPWLELTAIKAFRTTRLKL
jgi:hypothetical protein